MPSLRLFIAIETPATVTGRLLEVRNALERAGADVRWEPAGKYHCTLHFLGDTGEGAMRRIIPALEGALHGCSPVRIAYKGIGFFPAGLAPRIVWAGILDEEGRLASLHERIVTALSSGELAMEAGRPLVNPAGDPPFHPHMTLGRIKSPRNSGRLTTIAETCTFDHPPVIIREVVVVQSVLKSGGSVYTTLRSLPLIA